MSCGSERAHADKALSTALKSKSCAQYRPTHCPGDDAAILGVNPGNSPWLRAFGLATFSRVQDRVRAGGSLVVEGVDCDNPLGCVVTRHARVVWGESSTDLELCNQ